MFQCLVPRLVSSWCREGPTLWEIVGPVFRQNNPVLHLLFLRCLQLKIIKKQKGNILGWHVLNPFIHNASRYPSLMQPFLHARNYEVLYRQAEALFMPSCPYSLHLDIPAAEVRSPHAGGLSSEVLLLPAFWPEDFVLLLWEFFQHRLAWKSGNAVSCHPGRGRNRWENLRIFNLSQVLLQETSVNCRPGAPPKHLPHH